MDGDELLDEATYDARRLRQWLAGTARGAGISRRGLAKLAGAAGLAAAGGSLAPRPAAADTGGPIVKPLPPDLFYVYGSNAEMRWEAMSGQGYVVPIDRFYVRDHTSTPLLDADSWRLKLFGTGLHGAPTADNPVEFGYQDLLAMPAVTLTSFVECAGNGRSFFTDQQGESVSGTAWKLGAIGVAQWRGVPLAEVLARAGLTPAAVDVMPQGLDPDYVSDGVNLGKVRRPLPVVKALQDVLLAYQMNGETLPPDHGYPLRLIVPSWIGVSCIKWVGQIEVSDTPLVSPWNTQFYRLFGPDYPPDGELITRQTIKSAFELAWEAALPADQPVVLRGRSWSGHGAIRHVEVSTDGTTWHPARPTDTGTPYGWQRWEYPWQPPAAGSYLLRARATDTAGNVQPDQTTYNTLGYLFDAVVQHPVTVT
jgi:DMSO/TMAO reductase YedYZ molybdopterin-dependent catalytic subunit